LDEGCILIIDDEPINLKILSNLLNEEYNVMVIKSGQKALDILKSGRRPNLILLDVSMPEMDGYEVCEKLKSDYNTRDIPVIFISGMNNKEDEEKGFLLGAVDYITKPFIPSIVLARVNTHIRLSKALSELKRLYKYALESNPLTELPGNNAIAREIESSLKEKKEVCVMYLDLDNFKAYNDKYGFAMGDKIIIFTAELLKKKARGFPNSFIAHIGGDDFVAIIPSKSYVEYVEMFIEEFDEGIKKFYKSEDAKNGRIISIDRKGEIQEFPLISVSVACVDLKNTGYKMYLEVNDACAEIKKVVKNIPGSCYYVDRRKK